MSTNQGARTPAQQASWNRWHLIVALLLVVLLILLWLMGRGPGAALAGTCCGVDAQPVAVAASAPVAAADSDSDGVIDTEDDCPETPAGDRVGPHGCSCDISMQLQFEANSAVLTAEDRGQLDEAYDLMDRYKFATGEVAGYASSEGAADYNLELSKDRAQSVVEYLESKGVARGRLTSAAYGEAFPIAENTTEAGRQQNRRVNIRRSDCPAP